MPHIPQCVRAVCPLIGMLWMLAGCSSPDAPRSDLPASDSAAASQSAPNQTRAFNYPVARRAEQRDTYHGTVVADPYRWLEALSSEETANWVAAENALAEPYLAAIPAHARIKARLTELWSFERFGVPIKRGGKYFFRRNSGTQNQDVLYVAEDLAATPRVLLDPNTLSADGTVGLGEIVPSPDGRWLAYSLSDGGSDWKVWRIRDVQSGRDREDELRFIKFGPLSWAADSRSVFYSRYPLRADGSGDDQRQTSVYVHRLGEAQSRDALVFSITDHPTRNPYPVVSDDGRFLIIDVFEGYQATGLYYQRLAPDGGRRGKLVRLIDSFDAEYVYLGLIDNVLYVRTAAGAPNAHIIAIDTRKPERKFWREIVPEDRTAAISDASIVGRRLIAQYLRDARTQVRVFDLEGRAVYDVALPGLGMAQGFTGEVNDTETFFAYTDYLTPYTISRLDIASGRTSVFRAPKFGVDTSPYVTEQVFYRSKDGTRIPMFITGRRDRQRDGKAPLMLYGYGGFGSAELPKFSVPVQVWLEMGGVYAVANLRGGSEYGDDWHSAGTKLNKQNVFDDFIAAAEFLITERHTSKERLVIRGRSNGGLLVGAVLLQRPDLFAAALPAVGVLDMLRYQTASANARQWSSDYGLSESPLEFPALRAYSPVHNVSEGQCYPATLITTADRDDRVAPWHSYKFAAALQQAQSCNRPILLRVETRAGHGAGKPVAMQIEDFADQLAFAAAALGM
jgi:prolyl oligopeptidase